MALATLNRGEKKYCLIYLHLPFILPLTYDRKVIFENSKSNDLLATCSELKKSNGNVFIWLFAVPYEIFPWQGNYTCNNHKNICLKHNIDTTLREESSSIDRRYFLVFFSSIYIFCYLLLCCCYVVVHSVSFSGIKIVLSWHGYLLQIARAT